MSRKKRRLFLDLIFLVVSIFFAFYISKTGIASRFIVSLGDLGWLGIITAGMFFTSVFTTAPSIILLSQFAKTTPILVLTLLGGFGAMLGDYIIFKFVRDRIYDDVKYLVSFTKPKRFLGIFRTKLFHYFVPFIGAMIIASPFPDEIGIAMLGFSKIKPSHFSVISFIFNAIGIFMIGFVVNLTS